MTPEEDKRWARLETEEREQNRQNSQLDEQRFAGLFEDANKKIDELESEANHKKEKVVQELANDLKALGFPVNRIANEIVHQLKGRASRSWIHEILADEYKDKTHQEVAKKRWNHKVAAPLPVRHEEDLKPSPNEVATVTPVDQKQQITVGVDGHETTDTNSDLTLTSTPTPTEQRIPTIKSPEDSVKESPQPQPQQQQPQQDHLRILIDWDELSDKMAEVHHKDIKNFWLCGRIKNWKLLDMVLERSAIS